IGWGDGRHLVAQQAYNFVGGQLFTSAQCSKFDAEEAARDFNVVSFEEFAASSDSATGRQQIINDEYALACFDCVLVHFQGIAAILQLVAERMLIIREFARLSNGNECSVQF